MSHFLYPDVFNPEPPKTPKEQVDLFYEAIEGMKRRSAIEMAGLKALADTTNEHGGDRDDLCEAIARLAIDAWNFGHMADETRSRIVMSLGGKV